MKTNPKLATLATEFLLLPADMHVEEILIDKNLLMLVLSSTQLTAACPYCSSLSARVHCHYTRTLVDLLPDREAATVMAWLIEHPDIDMVSRDRASAYAQAIKKGAPQAMQVADRYHLLVNLHDHLKSFLDHKRTSLPKVEVDCSHVLVEDQQSRPNAHVEALAVVMKPLVAEQEPEPPQDASIASFIRDTKREKWFQKQSRAVLAQSQVSRSKRLARFEEVRALHQQGLSMRTIAHELGMSRNVVSKFIQAETFPEQTSRPRKGVVSKLDPFVPTILKRGPRRRIQWCSPLPGNPRARIYGVVFPGEATHR